MVAAVLGFSILFSRILFFTCKSHSITHHRCQIFPLNSNVSHISMQLRTVYFQCLDVDHAPIEKCRRYQQEKRVHFLHSLTSRWQMICKVSPLCWRYGGFDSIRLKITIWRQLILSAINVFRLCRAVMIKIENTRLKWWQQQKLILLPGLQTEREKREKKICYKRNDLLSKRLMLKQYGCSTKYTNVVQQFN